MAFRNFVVTVKEDGKGQPWLLVEPHEEIGLPQGTNVAMSLPKGADIHEAQRVARLINDNVAGVHVKRF